MVRRLVSGWLWKPNGRVSCHSREVGEWLEATIPRWDTRASHKIKMKKSNATNEIIDPILDRTFHLVYASG